MPRVGLFVTCLVDLFRPSVGLAAVELLEDAGCEVVVPELQTCCGQPAFSSGDRETSLELARRLIEAFEGVTYVVAPSGSCACMLKEHYPALLEPEEKWRTRARELADRTFELTVFLTEVLGVASVEAGLDSVATYHDSCHGLRDLGIRRQPRALLETVSGLELREMASSEVCCGFGGTFCVKYPEISERMSSEKAEWIEASGADLVLGGDLACLMTLAGTLKRRGSSVRVRHVAEVLAGRCGHPAIGEGEA